MFAISPGSYTATAGIPEIVHSVSEFITRRDGGVPSYPENIYISTGSQWALTVTSLTLRFKSLPPVYYQVNNVCLSLFIRTFSKSW